MSFLSRQTVIAALTANALRPPRRGRPESPPSPRLAGRRERSPAARAHRPRRRHAPDQRQAQRPRRQGRPGPRRRRAPSAWPTWSGRASSPATTWRTRSWRGSASTTSSSSTPRPRPAELRDPVAAPGAALQLHRRRRAGHQGPALLRGRQARPPRHLPPGAARTRSRTLPVLLQVHGGAWSVGEKHHQGRAADEPDGGPGLGVRGDQLPPRAARRLARPTSSTSSARSPGSRSTSPTTAATPTTSSSPAARRAVTWRRWPP